MSKAVILLLFVLFVFVGLPVLAYFCMKFGTAGHYRAKQFTENGIREEGESNGKTETKT